MKARGEKKLFGVIAVLFLIITVNAQSKLSGTVTDDDDHDNFLEYSDNKIVFIMNKLTDGYLGQSGLSIKSNILRYIIKFL